MDPYNPQTQLILLLYSMEPPFYADLNNACRTLDKTKLHTLGPFARAIFQVLLGGNISDEKRNDAIERGEHFYKSDDLGMMCRSFLLFRGALMQKAWIKDWAKKVGKDWFYLPGCTSTSKNLDVALGFS